MKYTLGLIAGLALAAPAHAEAITHEFCFEMTEIASMSVQARDLGIPAHEMLDNLLQEQPSLRGSPLYDLIAGVTVTAYTSGANMSAVEYGAVVLRACMNEIE